MALVREAVEEAGEEWVRHGEEDERLVAHVLHLLQPHHLRLLHHLHRKQSLQLRHLLIPLGVRVDVTFALQEVLDGLDLDEAYAGELARACEHRHRQRRSAGNKTRRAPVACAPMVSGRTVMSSCDLTVLPPSSCSLVKNCLIFSCALLIMFSPASSAGMLATAASRLPRSQQLVRYNLSVTCAHIRLLRAEPFRNRSVTIA